MPYIEYYIVGREFDWMILENHHDVVVGIGEPAESFVAAHRERLTSALGTS